MKQIVIGGNKKIRTIYNENEIKAKLKKVQKRCLNKYLLPLTNINEKLLIAYVYNLCKQFEKLTREQGKLNSNNYGTKKQQRRSFSRH